MGISVSPILLIKKLRLGNSLAVQWLGLGASTAWGPGSIPVESLRFHSVAKNEKKKQQRNWGSICCNMDGPRDYHIRWSNQTEKDNYHDITYMWNLEKKWYKLTYLQTRNRLTDIENKFMVTKGERGRG